MLNHVETVALSLNGYNKRSEKFGIYIPDVENSIIGIECSLSGFICSENDCDIDTCSIENLQLEGIIVIQAEKCFAGNCTQNPKKFCPLKKRVIVEIHKTGAIQ